MASSSVLSAGVGSSSSTKPAIMADPNAQKFNIFGLQHEMELNGVYEATTTMRHNKPIYQHDGKNNIIVWTFHANQQEINKFIWMISEKEHLDTENAYACSTDDCSSPVGCRNWLIFDRNQGKFIRNPGVTLEEV